MSFLTDQTVFSGSPANNDLVHMVDVDDTTTNPAGSSFALEISKLRDAYWTSGDTGTNSIKTVGSVENVSTGDYSVASGFAVSATSNYSYAIGFQTRAFGVNSYAEGDNTYSLGTTSHAEGQETSATTNYTHAEGSFTLASAESSHAEGFGTTAAGLNSHAEGNLTTASGNNSHAEGLSTSGTATSAHAEGVNTIASNYASHAEGQLTIASAANSHAGGLQTIASGNNSFTTGHYTESSGSQTYAGGKGTVTSYVVVDGENSFAHTTVTNPTLNTGVYGDRSAILGGINNYVASATTNSVILGGDSISATTDNMVYVPDLYINNCPAYADDAAAGVGGLTTGMVYQTNGSGAAPLNVAGILMIKQ